MSRERLIGEIISFRFYEEEGGISWLLSLSKILWVLIWFLGAASLFRFVNALYGPIIGVGSLALYLFIGKLIAPGSILLFDEIASRILPSLRSSLREGKVRIYDFRVLSPDQRVHGCLLKGDLIGVMPAQGDYVRLTGRFKHGTFQVRQGVIETTSSLLASRTLGHGWVLFVSLSIFALLVLFLFGVFDSLIFDFLHLNVTNM